MLDFISVELFGINHWYLSMLIYLIMFQIWYWITKDMALKKKLSPTYYCSLLHISMVIFPNLGMVYTSLLQEFLIAVTERSRHIILLSMSYFIIDTIYEPDRSWILHHALTITIESSVLILNRRTNGAAGLLFYAEIGALLYHLSSLYKNSIPVRKMFIIFYGFSRVIMLHQNFIQWKDLYLIYKLGTYSNLQLAFFFLETAITLATVFINFKFLYVQYKNYLKLIQKSKDKKNKN
eukprot:TRINITY_DN11920_c0_g1_i1.p1 TRINITY_DN11920_c0_g1~~TRINITY_DN11920_c0_g1_i1.p1  ORF type:complete len:236 (+),score=30.93 TRINITY_DN11920_c0_g1_i1:20-727(+)